MFSVLWVHLADLELLRWPSWVLPEDYEGSPQAGLLVWRGVSALGTEASLHRCLLGHMPLTCEDGEPLLRVLPMPMLCLWRMEGSIRLTRSERLPELGFLVGWVVLVFWVREESYRPYREGTHFPCYLLLGGLIARVVCVCGRGDSCLTQNTVESSWWAENTGVKVTLCWDGEGYDFLPLCRFSRPEVQNRSGFLSSSLRVLLWLPLGFFPGVIVVLKRKNESIPFYLYPKFIFV